MAEMISVLEIRKGMVYQFENELYECMDFQYFIPGPFSRMMRKIKVPVFLSVGEEVIVSTSDGTYIGRA